MFGLAQLWSAAVLIILAIIPLDYHFVLVGLTLCSNFVVCSKFLVIFYAGHLIMVPACIVFRPRICVTRYKSILGRNVSQWSIANTHATAFFSV